jgi:hypothetical protein
MHASSALARAAALFLALFAALPAVRAVVHKSIFRTAELSTKNPQDGQSGAKLISIAADGVVKIRFSGDETYTAHVGEVFADVRGRSPGTRYKLVSINNAKDGVVIEYEIRVYLKPEPAKPGKAVKAK